MNEGREQLFRRFDELGIEAPREISVHRQEVYEAIQRENRQAALLKPEDVRLLDPNTGSTE